MMVAVKYDQNRAWISSLLNGHSSVPEKEDSEDFLYYRPVAVNFTGKTKPSLSSSDCSQ